MKRNILLALFIALVSAVALPAQQSLRSAYFMEGYNYRHEFNPAFAAQRSYFALSTLGGVNTFLYPVDGGLTTFMNSSVSSDEFLGKLKKNNKLSVDVSTTLLSLGIWSGKSFWTFDMKTKVGADLNVPYALFDFMKNAGNSQFYDIAGLAARIDSRMEFSLGYARNINDIVNFGARVKFLLGIGNMEMKVNKMKVQMNEDKWSVDSKGSLNVSMGLLNIPTEGEIDSETAPENYDRISFDNIDTKDNLSIPSDMINGYGAAIDLGAEIEIIPDLRLSLAINDLGFMSWRNNVLATTDEKGWSFDGFDNFSFDSEKDNSLKNQFNDIGDGLEDLIKFRKVSDGGKRTQMLAMTMNFGAQYVMPFYDGLECGGIEHDTFRRLIQMDRRPFLSGSDTCKMVQFRRELRHFLIRFLNGSSHRFPHFRVQHVPGHRPYRVELCQGCRPERYRHQLSLRPGPSGPEFLRFVQCGQASRRFCAEKPVPVELPVADDYETDI